MPTEIINITGSDVTSSQDTNVLLSLSGTPQGAALEPFSINVSWSGQLSAARGGTGLSGVGSSLQLLRTNAGANALEYFSASTTDIPEGTNLYYTSTRFNSAFSAKSTSDLSEGSNLYFTTTRVLATALTGLSITGSSVVSTDTIIQAFGKLQNQVNGLVGGVVYKGTWNATTNTPALASGVGTKGNYYVVDVAGSTNLDGITDWKLGDWVIFNGATWQKVDNTDAVISVNGYTGAVTLTKSDLSLGNVENTALSTWTGSANITTVGTISSGSIPFSLVTGTIPILQGGSGQTTANGALNAFLPSQSTNANKYLKTDATNTSWSLIDLTASVSGVLPKANGGTGVNISSAALTLGTASANAGSIVFQNATNTNTLTINSGVTSASYSLTLPTAQGGASTFLQNNGSGVLSWVAASSGITVGTTTITSGTSLRIPYNLSGVYQEQANFTIGSVATGVLDVPVGYASRGVKFANQYDTGLQLTIGYLSGLGATMTNNTFDANYAYNTLVGIGAGNAISGSFAGGNTALGYEALKATGGAGNPEVYNNTAVGFRALGTWGAGTGYNVALGYRAGYGTGSTLRYGTFIGFLAADGTAFNSVIAIGAYATPTAANQCIIGATGAASGNGVIDNVYFNGVTHTSSANIAINAAGGSGTNNAGASLTLAGGKSTGSAAGGSLLFKTSTTLGSGTTLQSLATRLTISGGAVTTDASTATWADALDFVFGSTTGTKIGTATTQKIGFWNATPIVQVTTAVGSATLASPGAGTNIKTDDTFDGYTLQQVVKALRNLGLFA